MTRVLISVIARNSHQNRHRLRRSMSGTPRRHQREKNSELTAYMAVNISTPDELRFATVPFVRPSTSMHHYSKLYE